jgi:hypothetical protein
MFEPARVALEKDARALGAGLIAKRAVTPL